MLEIIKFQAWLRALGLNLIMDESELWAQSLKVEAWFFWAFEQLVHLWPNFTDLICSVHQYPSRQKVASIWAYMCIILRVHSNHSLCLFIPNLLTLHVQYTKILAVKKWLPFELICAVYLEYIATSVPLSLCPPVSLSPCPPVRMFPPPLAAALAGPPGRFHGRQAVPCPGV